MKFKRINYLILSVLFFINISFLHGKEYKIAVIPKSVSADFWKKFEIGIRKAEKEFNIKVVYRGPNFDEDVDSQIRIMESFLNKNYDLIAIAPGDYDKVYPLLEKANSQKIKIVGFDSNLKGDFHKTFIASDNLKAGRQAGEEALKFLNKDSKVFILSYNKGSGSTEEREKGFLEVIRENSTNIDIEYGGTSVGSCYRKSIESISKKNYDFIFTPNENTTLGVIKALKRLNLKNRPIHIGFDFSDDIKESIKSGTTYGVIVQDPEKMGYMTVKYSVDILKNIPIEKRVIIETKFIKKVNINSIK